MKIANVNANAKIQKINQQPSFFQFVRIPLLVFIILYAGILSLFLATHHTYFFDAWSTIIAVFGVPLLIAVFVAHHGSAQRWSLRESFVVELFFAGIALLVVYAASFSFSILLNGAQSISLLLVFLFFHFFSSVIFNLWPRRPDRQRRLGQAENSATRSRSSQSRSTKSLSRASRLFIHPFHLDRHLRRLGALHLVAFFLLIIFIAVLLSSPVTALIVLLFLVFLMKALEISYQLKNDLLLILVLLVAASISLFFFTIFSVIFLLGLILVACIARGHRGILSVPAHLLNSIFALIYALSFGLLLFVSLVVLDSYLSLSTALSPLLLLLLGSLGLIVSSIIFYYLFFCLTLRTQRQIISPRMLWPFSRLLPSTQSLALDAVMYGFVVALSILVIIALLGIIW